ncbi:adenylate/guanylate cyclase domain-containing protein [uncultured Roseobacter sp.]|uniref:CHASE2 domain-containing protein n=1 Tax=uncultured Roseobacter sp. TaxID=114847 RepID=UPI002609ED34|nr:adenylate/guanylate cyclase domain-containing protein [uncultured Roseobacter sp.]
MRQQALTVALAACAATLWAWVVINPHLAAERSLTDPAEAALLDLRFRIAGTVTPPEDVVIVAIDDATMAQAAQVGAPLRSMLARTITAVAAASPGAIGLDVILADPGEARADQALSEALASAPVIIAAAGRFSGTGPGVAQPAEVLRPDARFAEAAEVGLVNLSVDTTGVPRHLPVVFRTDHGIEPAFALRLAARFIGQEPAISAGGLELGATRVSLDDGFSMPLRLIGPRGSVPTYSAAAVLRGEQTAALTGKIVIVAITATGFGDRFTTPYGESVPGAEVLATAVSQLLGGPTLRRDEMTRRVDAVASGVIAVLISGLLLILPLSLGALLATGALATWMAVVGWAFAQGIWLSAAVPLASGALPFVLCGVLRYLIERRRAAQVSRSLAAVKLFQAPALAERIATDPDYLKTPVACRVAILFIDLSGFTRLSQQLGPEATQGLLKRFHGAISSAVEAQSGVVLDYMGDGALAVFGLTEAAQPCADQALAVAFALRENARALGPGDTALRCRIGLHYGAVVLSRLGGARHQQVSVAGDSVNLASRLLEIAKHHSADVAATAELMTAQTSAGGTPADRIETVPVRGRDGEVTVHFWMNRDQTAAA